MTVEYWLVDAESGKAQGCYVSLGAALEAAEIEMNDQPLHTLSLLGMASRARTARTERAPEPEQRLFVRLDLGLIREPKQ